MKTAYLILTYNQPHQLALLIRSLSHPDNSFFIHVDAKANIELFRKAVSAEVSHPNIFFLNNREKCFWGQYSLVAATLKLIRYALADQPSHYNHYILLSGQDYPIKSATHIKFFLEQHKGYDFIENYSLPSERLRERQNGLYRINRYHYFSGTEHHEFPPYSKKPLLNPLFNGIAYVYHQYFRKMPLGMEPYAGSQWWILCQATVNRLLHFLDQYPQVEKFFENTWIPDELFFQTIINYVLVDKSKVINNNYRFILWDDLAGKNFLSNPEILTEEHWTQINNSDALFARKFDEEKSLELIRKLNHQYLFNDDIIA